MLLDVYYARVNGMIQSGVFEDIGRATVRLEGGTALGVWLRIRIDHWSTALGRRPRMRCGVLYHSANWTLSFHGIADDAVRSLISLFERWTSSSITQLPSVRSNRQPTPSNVPSVRSNQCVPPNGPPPPLPHPVPRVMQEQQLIQDDSSPRPQKPDDRQTRGDDALRSMVHQLIDVCYIKQRHRTGLREEVTNLLSQITVLVSRTPVGVPTPISVVAPDADSHMAVPQPVPNALVSGDRQKRVCRRSGCDTAVPTGCCVQFCQAHRTSPRCPFHGQEARNSDRSCRHPGCEARVPPRCTSCFCQFHCNSRRCQVHMNHPRCSTAECDSPPATGCLVGCDRLWPNRLWPSLFDRLWPNRPWRNRLWPTILTDFGQS